MEATENDVILEFRLAEGQARIAEAVAKDKTKQDQVAYLGHFVFQIYLDEWFRFRSSLIRIH